jgi:hypothetical protein
MSISVVKKPLTIVARSIVPRRAFLSRSAYKTLRYVASGWDSGGDWGSGGIESSVAHRLRRRHKTRPWFVPQVEPNTKEPTFCDFDQRTHVL